MWHCTSKFTTDTIIDIGSNAYFLMYDIELPKSTTNTPINTAPCHTSKNRH